MTHAEIHRVKIHTGIEAEIEMPSVREEAESILGYRRPQSPGPSVDPLAEAIGKLDIEILDWKDVLTYQFEARKKMDMESLSRAIASRDSMPNIWDRRGSDWIESEISEYKGHVPDHALQKALEIKRAVPEVRIYVEHLERDRDPFLVVRIGDSWNSKSYYVEVWDEPGFERR